MSRQNPFPGVGGGRKTTLQAGLLLPPPPLRCKARAQQRRHPQGQRLDGFPAGDVSSLPPDWRSRGEGPSLSRGPPGRDLATPVPLRRSPRGQILNSAPPELGSEERASRARREAEAAVAFGAGDSAGAKRLEEEPGGLLTPPSPARSPPSPRASVHPPPWPPRPAGVPGSLAPPPRHRRPVRSAAASEGRAWSGQRRASDALSQPLRRPSRAAAAGASAR